MNWGWATASSRKTHYGGGSSSPWWKLLPLGPVGSWRRGCLQGPRKLWWSTRHLLPRPLLFFLRGWSMDFPTFKEQHLKSKSKWSGGPSYSCKWKGGDQGWTQGSTELWGDAVGGQKHSIHPTVGGGSKAWGNFCIQMSLQMGPLYTFHTLLWDIQSKCSKCLSAKNAHGVALGSTETLLH